jgi:hypothetical protein
MTYASYNAASGPYMQFEKKYLSIFYKTQQT